MEAPTSVREEFAELLATLAINPSPEDNPSLDITPLAHFPGGWCAPFDDGLLAIKIMADYPIIELKDVLWL